MRNSKKVLVILVIGCFLFYLNSFQLSYSQTSSSNKEDSKEFFQKVEQNRENTPSLVEREESEGDNGGGTKTIILVAAGVLVAGVVAYLLLKGKEEKKEEEKDQSVYSQGQFQVRGTWGCDLDIGKETYVEDPSTDFQWSQQTAVERYISPRNGAKFHVIGKVDFNSIKYSQLKSYSYSSDKINGSDNASNQIPQGTVVAAITNTGRYCKFRIDTYGYTLTITYLTYKKE